LSDHEKKRVDPDLARESSASASFPVSEKVDPNVMIPADVQASIARAESAAVRSGQGTPGSARNGLDPDFRTAVTDQVVQDARDNRFDGLEAAGRGKRQQPAMIDRMRAADVIVERELADGTPFKVGRNSVLNRKIREWLNAKAARTKDDRKSRKKQIGSDAVRNLLRHLKAVR
jgi:hypothetical protein